MKAKTKKTTKKLGPKTIIAELVQALEEMKKFAPASPQGHTAEEALQHARKFLTRKPAKRLAAAAKNVADAKPAKTPQKSFRVAYAGTEVTFLDKNGGALFKAVFTESSRALHVAAVGASGQDVPIFVQPMGWHTVSLCRSLDFAAVAKKKRGAK